MSRNRCCCCCNNRCCGCGYGGYGGYGCGGYGGAGYGGVGCGGNSCCNFSCLIILILILLFFSRKRCSHKPDCEEGIGRRCEGLDGGIIFVITLFYLCCCSPCGGRGRC